MSEPRIDLSVVVAAYNEQAVISQNMRRIIDALSARPGVNWELICVNDGSTDQTGAHMEAVARTDPRIQVLHHRRNFGQGRALRTGLQASRGDAAIWAVIFNVYLRSDKHALR